MPKGDPLGYLKPEFRRQVLKNARKAGGETPTLPRPTIRTRNTPRPAGGESIPTTLPTDIGRRSDVFSREDIQRLRRKAGK